MGDKTIYKVNNSTYALPNIQLPLSSPPNKKLTCITVLQKFLAAINRKIFIALLSLIYLKKLNNILQHPKWNLLTLIKTEKAEESQV